MGVPTDRKYSQTHEWYKADGNVITMGITQFAADELTDITYVELPEVGRELEAGGAFGEIESVKATSDVFSAVPGKIVEINERLRDAPELLNSDPFEAGWIVRVEARDLGPLDKLLAPADYDQHIAD